MKKNYKVIVNTLSLYQPLVYANDL